MILLDVNILLYAYSSTSPAHAVCKKWLEDAIARGEQLGLPWTTVLAFIRISSNVAAFGSSASLNDAIDRVEDLLAAPGVQLLSETPSHWATLKGLLRAGQATGKLVMDAHLAAMAMEHGARVCTNDRDFARFGNIRIVNPLE